MPPTSLAKPVFPARCHQPVVWLAAAVLLGISLVVASLATARPAGAEISDTARNNWGVIGLDQTSSTDANNHVWAVEQIGNVIYVAGKFNKVIGNGERFDQPYLAAFHADTGRWINWWRPKLNGPAYALAKSPDGQTLFVGGEFTTVNGKSTSALAALVPATGRLKPGWTTRVTGGGPAAIHDFDVQGPWLYIGGAFRSVGRNGVAQPARSAVRIRHRDGVIDSVWKPQVSGGSVYGIAASPTLNRVYLAGFFEKVNGSAAAAFGAVLNGAPGSNGAPIPGLRHVANTTQLDARYQLAVEVHRGRVYFGGSQHNLHVYRESDMALERTYLTQFAGGDIQHIEAAGNRIYVGCHCWDAVYEAPERQQYPFPAAGAIETPVRGLFAINADTGRQIRSFNVTFSGSSGVWAIHVNPADGCLWVGGDIRTTTTANRPVDRLARLCDSNHTDKRLANRLRPPAPGVCSARVVKGTQAFLSWGKAPFAENYVIFRDGQKLRRVDATRTSVFDLRPGPGTHRYKVLAVSGTTTSRVRTCNPAITIVPPPPKPVVSCRVVPAAGGGNYVSYVRADADRATAVVVERARSGGSFFWAARRPLYARGWTDANAVSGVNYTYRVIVVGGGGESAPTVCTRPSGT